MGAAFDTTMKALAPGEPLLAAGDWEGYWATWPAPLPEQLTQHFERTNDPKALAAALRAMPEWSNERPGFGLAPCELPRFAYFGVGEVWADQQRAELAASDLTVFEGGWPGHAETMIDAAGVTSCVVPFLRSVG